jgi:hypothetical protein
MPFLNTHGLAERWMCSTRKIEQQRQSGEGPTYVKIGHQVLYDEEVVRAYEAENTFSSTTENDLNSPSSQSSLVEQAIPLSVKTSPSSKSLATNKGESNEQN